MKKSLKQKNQSHPAFAEWLFVRGGEKEIRTLVGVLAQTRFPVVRLRPAQPSLRATTYIFYHTEHKKSSTFFIFFNFFIFLFSFSHLK